MSVSWVADSPDRCPMKLREELADGGQLIDRPDLTLLLRRVVEPRAKLVDDETESAPVLEERLATAVHDPFDACRVDRTVQPLLVVPRPDPFDIPGADRFSVPTPQRFAEVEHLAPGLEETSEERVSPV